MLLSIAELLILEHEHWSSADLYDLAGKKSEERHLYVSMERIDFIFNDNSWIAFLINDPIQLHSPALLKYGNKWKRHNLYNYSME